jgi:hypothetical protein
MGLLSYLRGDDLLEDRSTRTPSEAWSLPPAENQLPLMAGYTLSSVMPTQALAITAGGAAVRLTQVAPVSRGNGPAASAAGPCLEVRRG